MPVGFITQSAVILMEAPPGLVDLERAVGGIAEYRVLPPPDPTPGPWIGGEPGLSLKWRPEVHGACLVDVVPEPWPDDMGDPKTNLPVFGAWVMSQFGPLVYPGGLERAAQFGQGKAVHRAVVRVRTTYAAGASPEDPVVPPDYAPLPELEFVTSVARRLLDLPGALAYFNPNGETLLDRATLSEMLDYHAKADLLPLPVWVGMHLFAPSGKSRQRVMTTVGLEQLDVPDHELWFDEGSHPPGEIASFLWNAGVYVQQKGDVVRDGDTMDGPGGQRWSGRKAESFGPRPRTVYKWTRPRKKWFGLF